MEEVRDLKEKCSKTSTDLEATKIELRDLKLQTKIPDVTSCPGDVTGMYLLLKMGQIM